MKVEVGMRKNASDGIWLKFGLIRKTGYLFGIWLGRIIPKWSRILSADICGSNPSVTDAK
jgi:hypothetical protein